MQLKKTGIIIVGSFDAITDDVEQLRKFHDVQLLPQLSRQETIERFKELAQTRPYHAVIFFAGHYIAPFNEELLGALTPSLRLVCGTGAGFDHVDVDYLSSAGVTYANTPIAVSDPTATTAVLLILQAVRASSQAEATVRRGEWRKGLESTPDVRDLTVGIVGLGTIGKLVQQKVEALGFRTIYYNRRRLPADEEGKARYVSFEELIKTADVISLHTPLTPQTRHLLSDAEFAQMKDGVFIVNTARGPVIDEKALVRALQSGKVSRVGLDVYEREPIVDPFLMNSERASLLPHWAVATTRIGRDTQLEAFGNLKSWLVNGRPNTPVNDPAPFGPW